MQIHVSQAVRDTLAPLKTVDTSIYDRAVGYVLGDATPSDTESVLARLGGLAPADVTRLTDLLDSPGPKANRRHVSPEEVAAVAALHPTWTAHTSERARRAVYAAADPGVVARLSMLLLAVVRTAPLNAYDEESDRYVSVDVVPEGVPAWLALFVNDLAVLGYPPYGDTYEPTAVVTAMIARCTPDFVHEVALAGAWPTLRRSGRDRRGPRQDAHRAGRDAAGPGRTAGRVRGTCAHAA